MNKPILQIYASKIKMTPGTNLSHSPCGWVDLPSRGDTFLYTLHNVWKSTTGNSEDATKAALMESTGFCPLTFARGRLRAYAHTCKQSVPADKREEKSLPYLLSHTLSLTHTQSYSIKIEWTVWKHKAQQASLVSYFKFPMITSLSAFREERREKTHTQTHPHPHACLSAAALFTLITVSFEERVQISFPINVCVGSHSSRL